MATNRNRRRSRDSRRSKWPESICGKVADSMEHPQAFGPTLLVSGTGSILSRRKAKLVTQRWHAATCRQLWTSGAGRQVARLAFAADSSFPQTPRDGSSPTIQTPQECRRLRCSRIQKCESSAPRRPEESPQARPQLSETVLYCPRHGKFHALPSSDCESRLS
jgi:hypothetical protein